MKINHSLIYNAWKKLILAYAISFVGSLFVGTLLVKIGLVHPEGLFEMSTKRLSYVLPVFDMGSQHGIDMGIMLFGWNSIGALITISFIYTAAWFNPDRIGLSPQGLRKIFSGKKRMKLLCHLPGCSTIEAEPLRRVYVWLMVPLLGIVLLGIESGLQVSSAAHIFGSFFPAVIGLLPHGLIEIPTFALAGAVAYSAHPLIDEQVRNNMTGAVFQKIEAHTNAMPILKIAALVIGGLFFAGLVEAHVTQWMLERVLSVSP